MIRPEGTYICTNPNCNEKYPEYVNGCPRCSTGEAGGSHKVVHEKDLFNYIMNLSDIQLEDRIGHLRDKLKIN